MKRTLFRMMGAFLLCGALVSTSVASVPLRIEMDADSKALFEASGTKVLRVGWGVYQEC